MDQKTKEFVEQCERHLLRDNNAEFGDLARDDLPEALRIIREQAGRIAGAEAMMLAKANQWEENRRETLGGNDTAPYRRLCEQLEAAFKWCAALLETPKS